MDDVYAEAVAFIFGNANYNLNPLPQEQRWERFTQLLSAIGDPQLGLRVVHIAGTNGKGTTSAIMDAMLRASGARTGLFTSPHLHSWRERIRVNGALVAKDEVIAAWELLRPHIQIDVPFTPFEKLTALALVCFRRAGVEWAVLETGLGGRYDCTNHVPVPAVVGLCRIGLDHVAVLGDSIGQIAWHKAGIIKAAVPAFSVPQPADARAVFEATASELGAPLAFVSADDSLASRALVLAGASSQEGELIEQRQGQAKDKQGVVGAGVEKLPTWLRPSHQLENFALAAAMVASLIARGLLSSSVPSQAHEVQQALPSLAAPSPPLAAAATAAGGAGDGSRGLVPDALLIAALHTSWPGRTELVSAPPAGQGAGAEGAEGAAAPAQQSPGAGTARGPGGAFGAKVVFDVAHNEDAVRALLRNLPRIVPSPSTTSCATSAAGTAAGAVTALPGGEGARADTASASNIELIFGANKDKDMRTMLQMIGSLVSTDGQLPEADSAAGGEGGGTADGAAHGQGAGRPNVLAIHLVASPHPKACPPAELAAIARAVAPGAPWRTEHATMADALAAAAAGNRPDLDCTIAFGSVFVVAEARAQLARLRPDMFSPSDWAFDAAGEPPIV